MNDETVMTRRAGLELFLGSGTVVALAGCTDRIPVDRPVREDDENGDTVADEEAATTGGEDAESDDQDDHGNDHDAGDDDPDEVDDGTDAGDDLDEEAAEEAIDRATLEIAGGFGELAGVEYHLQDPETADFDPGDGAAQFDLARDHVADAEAADDGTFAADIELRESMLAVADVVTAALEDLVADEDVVGLDRILADFEARRFDAAEIAAGDMEAAMASVNADIQPAHEQYLGDVASEDLVLEPPEPLLSGIEDLHRSFAGAEDLAAAFGETIDAWRAFEDGEDAYLDHAFETAETAFQDAKAAFVPVEDAAEPWTESELPIGPEWTALYCHAHRMVPAAAAFADAADAMQDNDIATASEKESTGEEYLDAAMDCV